MRKVALLALVVPLSACASTQEALNRPVTQTFHSTQTAREVASCLADHNDTTVVERNDGSRVVLIKNLYGAVSLAFSVYPEGAGSRIEYRRIFGTIGGIWRRCVGATDAD